LDRKLHSTAIVVTHDIACAREVASRWCYLSGGRILADGRAEELFQSGEAELREFLADFARDGPSSTAAGRSPAGAAAEGEP
jgi:ABC-type transporter Mla maintaining outer membrane lipid asymmetry ATPase subunit MlaF